MVKYIINFLFFYLFIKIINISHFFIFLAYTNKQVIASITGLNLFGNILLSLYDKSDHESVDK